MPAPVGDGWVPVEDRLPANGQAVFMMDDEGRQMSGYFLHGLWRFFYWGSGRPIEYWKPSPCK